MVVSSGISIFEVYSVVISQIVRKEMFQTILILIENGIKKIF
jgi:hypothetical protein